MRITGVEPIISEVSTIFCDHSIRIQRAGEYMYSDLNIQGSPSQPLVDLTYGATITIDAQDFHDLFLICHTTGGGGHIRQGWQTLDVRAGQTMIMSAGLRTRLDLHDAFTQVSIPLNKALLERNCARILGRPLGDPFRFDLGIMSDEANRQWKNILSMVRQNAESPTAACKRTNGIIDDFVVNWLLSSQNHNYREEFEAERHGPEPAVVRRAERIMRENASRLMSVVDVAETMGVSLRTLQAAFRTWRNITPSAFLREIKLNEARRMLTSDNPASVSAVALDAGFTHMGRFSECYRRQFGETPVTTRRRHAGMKRT